MMKNYLMLVWVAGVILAGAGVNAKAEVQYGDLGTAVVLNRYADGLAINYNQTLSQQSYAYPGSLTNLTATLDGGFVAYRSADNNLFKFNAGLVGTAAQSITADDVIRLTDGSIVVNRNTDGLTVRYNQGLTSTLAGGVIGNLTNMVPTLDGGFVAYRSSDNNLFKFNSSLAGTSLQTITADNVIRLSDGSIVVNRNSDGLLVRYNEGLTSTLAGVVFGDITNMVPTLDGGFVAYRAADNNLFKVNASLAGTALQTITADDVIRLADGSIVVNRNSDGLVAKYDQNLNYIAGVAIGDLTKFLVTADGGFMAYRAADGNYFKFNSSLTGTALVGLTPDQVVALIPEPATVVLLGLGSIVAMIRRRK